MSAYVPFGDGMAADGSGTTPGHDDALPAAGDPRPQALAEHHPVGQQPELVG